MYNLSDIDEYKRYIKVRLKRVEELEKQKLELLEEVNTLRNELDFYQKQERKSYENDHN